MPYTVGMSIRRGTREESRIIIEVNAENVNKAAMVAEDQMDCEYGPDLYSKALAVTESVSSEYLAVA
jgi:hypothetical protein